MSGRASREGKQRQVRIIGGLWRGRKLRFTPSEGLRPTGDRIRETLFNWLGPYIENARCADLFAGSGALGLEALSRGAVYCDFVDTNSAVVSQITEHLRTLHAHHSGACHRISAQQFLQRSSKPYDIVFVDPPFNFQMVEPVCAALADSRLLTRESLIYVEAAATQSSPTFPAGWNLRREKTAGGVTYRLFENDLAGNAVC
jgi:16S rRNA (guanine966-N2)-methyltransferase